jgi:hypothetical protein
MMTLLQRCITAMNKQTEIARIGFAAYLKYKGYQLIEVQKKGFIFEFPEDTDVTRLQTEYLNSEARRVDVDLCLLRDLQRQARGITQ